MIIIIKKKKNIKRKRFKLKKENRWVFIMLQVCGRPPNTRWRKKRRRRKWRKSYINKKTLERRLFNLNYCTLRYLPQEQIILKKSFTILKSLKTCSQNKKTIIDSFEHLPRSHIQRRRTLSTCPTCSWPDEPVWGCRLVGNHFSTRLRSLRRGCWSRTTCVCQ